MKIEINGYSKRRKHAYPPVEDQLDMLWHAMERGEIPKAKAFFDALSSVKREHPKGGPPGRDVP